MTTDVHVGKMIKDIIYSNHLNISDLARKIHVDRRSVYNWFKQKSLRPYTLKRICYVLFNDYSIKLPDTFFEEYLQLEGIEELSPHPHSGDSESETDTHTVQYWMNKYISILEKYNEVLVKGVPKENQPSEKRK